MMLSLGNNHYNVALLFGIGGCIISVFFFYIPINFTVNKQRLQDDATRSMEIHSNPVTITFNIDIQIDITYKYYK